MQKLIMPFERQMMLCGYKNAEYLKHWGYSHYGVDISTIQGGAGTDANLYASGDGTVALTGYDNGAGNVIAIIYPDCYNHHTGQTYSLVARYMHLKSISVKAGEKVKAGDKIGIEGNTMTGDYHLHIEFDTDTKWPAYSPQVKGSNIIKKGSDSTVNPSYIFYVSDSQAIVKPTYNPAWLNAEDFAIPKLEKEPDYKALCEELQNRINKMKNFIAGA